MTARAPRPALFAVPTRAEFKRAALLSLLTTALCLLWPLAALAQEAAQSGAAINVDLGTGAGLTTRVVQLVGLMTVVATAGTAQLFRARKTGDGAWSLYRVA